MAERSFWTDAAAPAFYKAQSIAKLLEIGGYDVTFDFAESGELITVKINDTYSAWFGTANGPWGGNVVEFDVDGGPTFPEAHVDLIADSDLDPVDATPLAIAAWIEARVREWTMSIDIANDAA